MESIKKKVEHYALFILIILYIFYKWMSDRRRIASMSSSDINDTLQVHHLILFS